MRYQLPLACFAVFFMQNAANGLSPQDVKKEEKAAAFTLADVKYFHRFTKDEMHEFTPAGQKDLKHWTDMVTINYYRKAKDAEAIATAANATLGTYKAAQGLVIRTDSVPRTKDKPAEHLMVVAFLRPKFVEVAFARFRMHGGIGTSVVYSHRIYGKEAENKKKIGVWIKKNGPMTETNLMKWKMPKGDITGTTSS